MSNSPSPCPSTSPPKSFEACGSAPGRVEFIGNHIDYNGGWVLGATIDRRIEVGLTRRDDRQVRLESSKDVPVVRLPLDEVTSQGGDHAWANYVLGVLDTLSEEGLSLPTGFNLFVHSTLPTGAGLSSSAALELATAFALTELFAGPFDRSALAQLSRRAENDFVGVPCGILDQAVVAFGDEDRLVRVDARTETLSAVPFPADTYLWIFRSHRPHSLVEAHYQDRYEESRAARDRLNDLLGHVEHLANVSPNQLASVRGQLAPSLYRRARHVSTEHRRVEKAVRLLQEGNLEAVGDLLLASHESSRTDYENSTPELDFLVQCLADENSVLGARLTGAGFGGAVMAWTRAGFDPDDARAIKEAYAKEFGAEVKVLSCQTAPGAFGHSTDLNRP